MLNRNRTKFVVTRETRFLGSNTLKMCLWPGSAPAHAWQVYSLPQTSAGLEGK